MHYLKLLWAAIILVFPLTEISCQERHPIDLGIGLAVASNPYQFENRSQYDKIYTNKDLKTKFKNSSENKIYPFFYKPDYGLYHFICLNKTKNYYKILINDSAIAFIPNDTNFYFVTWETILLNSSVERITKDNPIRENSTSDSSIINYDCEPERLKVEEIIEMKNEYWLFVSFDPTCQDNPNNKTLVKYGWIKWRTKNKLLIEVLLLC